MGDNLEKLRFVFEIIAFRSQMRKHFVLRIIYLPAHSSRVETFAKSANYKLKIKAVNGRNVSYHNAGTFSVTCTSTRRSEGRMSFQLSSYGSGLGPSISAKEFESNR